MKNLLYGWSRLISAIAMLRRTGDLSTAAGRANDRHRRVVATALASGAARAISIATGLISIPLTLHHLGADRYGVWIVISSFTIMLSFADMGLGNGVLNAVADKNGQDDRRAIREVVSSGYFALGAIAALILLAFVAAYPFVRWHELFNASTRQAMEEAGPAMAVFILCFALTIVMGLVQKIQIGLQQGFISSLWQCFGSVLSLMALLAVIHIGSGLPWLVAALVGMPLLAVTLNSIVFFARKGRDIAPSLRFVSRSAMRKTLHVGALFFILQLVVSVAYGMDTLIIAQSLGAPAVAQYSVPERLFSIVTMLIGILLSPLWPAYGEAISRGDHQWVGQTLKKALRLAFLTSVLCTGALVIFAPYIIRIWVGDIVQPSLLLLLGLALWKTVECSGIAYATYLNGANLLKFQIIVSLISGGAMLALKLLLVPHLGAAGIPWAASIAFLPLAMLPIWYVVNRHLAKARTNPGENVPKGVAV